MTTVAELTASGLAIEATDAQGRVSYAPIFVRVSAASQYNDKNPPERHAWGFQNLPGFWTCTPKVLGNEPPLGVGLTYQVRLTTKPYTKQDNSPGLYQDVQKIRIAAPEEQVPAQQPAASGNTPQTGSLDDYRRSKEEMRWTEAYHMATRIIPGRGEGMLNRKIDDGPEEDAAMEAYLVSWAGWFYNELVACTEPTSDQAEEDGPYQASEEPEMPPPVDEPGDDLPF